VTKKAGSGSGSISQWHGSADPDPLQNVMDPEHWFRLQYPFFLGDGIKLSDYDYQAYYCFRYRTIDYWTIDLVKLSDTGKNSRSPDLLNMWVIYCARISVQSSRIGSPHPQASVAPPFRSKGDTLACGGGGVRGPNSDEGTDTLVLYVYYNPTTVKNTV
jgi:hypothetical protein